jgi:hypothetical protein
VKGPEGIRSRFTKCDVIFKIRCAYSSIATGQPERKLQPYDIRRFWISGCVEWLIVVFFVKGGNILVERSGGAGTLSPINTCTLSIWGWRQVSRRDMVHDRFEAQVNRGRLCYLQRCHCWQNDVAVGSSSGVWQRPLLLKYHQPQAHQ